MWTVKIDEMDFTLFYDIDQLKENKITLLSEEGKIQWFKERCYMLMVRPVTLAFENGPVLNKKEKFFIAFARLFGLNVSVNKEKYRLVEMTTDGQANHVIGMFSVLMNGIEALGSFITIEERRPGQNRRNFDTFIKDYMSTWNIEVNEPSFTGTRDMKTNLWRHFRNGITHGFSIEHGGINFEADTAPNGYLITPHGYLQIGPRKFIHDFNEGLKNYFADIKFDVGGKIDLFFNRFNSIYPH